MEHAEFAMGKSCHRWPLLKYITRNTAAVSLSVACIIAKGVEVVRDVRCM